MKFKIQKIFLASFFALALFIFGLFSLSIYYRHFFREIKPNGNVVENQVIDPEVVSVRVFNATDVNGLAKELKLYLKTFQVENISVENFGEFKRISTISSKPDKIAYAKYIASLIDYNADSVKICDTIDWDILVIIGKDYRLLKPFNK